MPKAGSTRTPRSAAAGPAFHELVSYRLQKAAYYATRPAYLAYAREFGITGVEWRLLGNLYAAAPLTLARVAEEADVQPAQASRVLAALVQRGLVSSQTDAHDARAVRLALTAEGRALYRRLLARTARLHDTLVAELDAAQREQLYRMLDLIADAGRRLLVQARAAARADAAKAKVRRG